ncbi:efflux RND transporter periplasmic adaptor subunit [Pectinatus haikarae]|uniref:HlyD family secretion protein/macrolide-specific efflux system membrane fusion protein n=1 Tax=Pectinatus haikarae TaxID=349096 RepID=A0ABT9YDC8_9FIRM|nr:efflux RND transporter periplasmic adaptor subunit [Pectinatus haikarae]MDQ0205034.1 HlyD family secretion protein/macrolide-specific efflux system membrane fusion protein [Pectinatus haikarae]
MKKKSIIKIAAAIVIVAVLGFAGYKYWSSYQEKNNAAQAGEPYTVQKMDLKSVVSATGTIKPVESVEVSSKITARIKSVLVKENDSVKAGQTVAVLDGKDLENELIKAQETVSNTLSKYNRAKYLYSIGAKSKEDYEDAEYNYETAQSDMEVTKSDLDETIITAPMDGVVVGEPKTPGTMAVQGTSNPTVIMRVADLSQKQILAKVDETDIGQIKVGQSVVFTVDAYTDKNFTGKVAKISQTDVSNSWDTSSDSTSTSSTSSVIYYYVTLDVDDPDGLLKPAMTARVEITTGNKADAVAVPLAALKTDSSGSYVIIVNDNKTTENRYVKTGIYSDDYVEILDGLNEGEKVSIEYTAPKTSTSSSKQGGGPPF